MEVKAPSTNERRPCFIHARAEVSLAPLPSCIDRTGGGARFPALTAGGAIPDTADYQVMQEPEGLFVGTVNEDFAIESVPGDIFLLGNTAWRILRVDQGVDIDDARASVAAGVRRLLRDVAEGRALGDTTTLADPAVVQSLKDKYESQEG